MWETYDGTNWKIKSIEDWLFGEAFLEAGGEGQATWSMSVSAGTKRSDWSARLDGGKQSSWNDYAKVVVPVNEMPFTDLDSVVLEPYYTASVGIDMGVCVYMHDPDDFDESVELSHTPYTNSAAGWRELDFPTEPGGTSWFWYGTVSATPDTCPTEGTAYTWANFQADSVFSTWTIFKITFDYGYYTGDVVMNECYLCQARINDITIPLKPDSGGTGRIGHQYYTVADTASNSLTLRTPFRLISIDCEIDTAGTTSESLTITKNAGIGAAYDTLLYSVNTLTGSTTGGAITSLLVPFGDGYDFTAWDVLDMAWPNTEDRTLGFTWTYQTVF